MDNPKAYFARLKPVHLFKGLTDEQIVEVATAFEVETHGAKEFIFKEGDEGRTFYLLTHGQVRLSHLEQGRSRVLATLVAGDYFGEQGFLHGQRRNATVEALTSVEMLRLEWDAFNKLMRRFPQMRLNLLVSAQSRALARYMRFNWLGPEEVVYLIARRHPVLLYQALTPPLGLAVVAVLVALATGYFWDWVLGGWVALLLLTPLAVWAFWANVDWGNDYFIVTNQRVVYLEKIIGIYDSRQEAPLNQVTSVDVRSDDAGARALGMGDVVVRSYSSPIVMNKVENPQAIAGLVEEHWHRTRTSARQAELSAMRQVIRNRIAPPPAPPPSQTPEPPPTKKKTRPPGRPLSEQLASAFMTRYQVGPIITYRKHWYVLVEGLWKPSAFILLLAVALGLALGGVITQVPLSAVALVTVVGWVPLSLWWLYEYIDWRNDIYQVTEDQIWDITKTPLGQETRKSAPLANILSLKYERPGVLGVLLNYGSVVAQIGNDEFRFDGVLDPVGVQNDIYRRMEEQVARKAQAESDKRRDEMAVWLDAYYQVEAELRRNPPPQ